MLINPRETTILSWMIVPKSQPTIINLIKIQYIQNLGQQLLTDQYICCFYSPKRVVVFCDPTISHCSFVIAIYSTLDVALAMVITLTSWQKRTHLPRCRTCRS